MSLGLAILPALLLLLAAEVILRLAGIESPEKREEIFWGFRGAPPLFYKTRSQGVPVFRTSPNRLEFFNLEEFPATKPPGSLRLFAIGGSTAYGEPWGDRGSFAHFLESRLKDANPGRAVEVVNAGGKGYGSTALVELTREILRYEPDALLLYTGQNELREAAFHPNEREGGSSVPAWRALLHRHSRVYLALRRLIRRLIPLHGGAAPKSFAAREIAGILARPFGPESFSFPPRLGIPPIVGPDPNEARVYRRFEENLGAIFRLAAEHRVPCLVIAQLRNEQFWFTPNRSRLRPGAESDYERLYRTFLDAAGSGRREEALAVADSISSLYLEDRDAYLHVFEGDLLLGLGRAAAAREAYQTAWGDDPLNAHLAAAAGASGVPFVEAGRAARAVAPDSILGFSVFYDEIHPTPLVHRAIAEALLPALESAGIDAAEAARLRSNPAPLPERPDAEVLAYEALRALYLGRLGDAGSFAESAAAQAPGLGKAHVYAGICAAARGDVDRARRAWETLARLYPELRPER